MWDTTALDLRTLEPNGRLSLRFVVSHISRKTSEIWGTRRFVANWHLVPHSGTLQPLLLPFRHFQK
jgi:hypothetical protein